MRLNNMSLQHFFLDKQILSQETEGVFELRLCVEDVKHARVLRLHAGEHIAVIDADSDYFECEIVRFDRGEQMFVSIAGHETRAVPRAEITLAQGLAKGSKVDDVIRGGTEIGVSLFVPLACSRSVLKLDAKGVKKKVARWNAIAKSAAMQSGQVRVPYVCEPVSVQDFCASAAEFDAVCICWEEANVSVGFGEALASVKKQLSERDLGDIYSTETTCPEAALKAKNTENARPLKIAIIVGPEGGLTSAEVDALMSSNKNSHLVSMGPGILRTETAGVLAPALAMYELGLLGGCGSGACAAGSGFSASVAASGTPICKDLKND